MGLGVIIPSTLAGVILNDIGPELGNGIHRIFTYAGIDQPMPDWDCATNEFRRIFKNTVFQTDDDMNSAIRATWREGNDGMLRVNWDVRIVKSLNKRQPLPDLWRLFRSLQRLPVLALRGEISEILDPDTLHRMVAEHDGLTHVEVKQTGHAPSLNEPESVKAINDFLENF
jgi:pimeloyl-ACP methyl ester carboxylesterase